MIVDALAHITGDGRWFDTGLDASLESLLAMMKRDAVEKAVLAGIPGMNDDDTILTAVNDHPGRFLPVAGVDASLTPRAMSERLEQVKEKGFVGIKLHPRLSRMPLTHPNFKAGTQLAGKLGLTAMICTIHRPPLPPLGRPLSDVLYELCLECDTTRIILVHGGYTDLLATSELIRPLEHVLLDLSLTATRFGVSSLGHDMGWLIDTFDRRLVIGSDFPEGSMGETIQTLNGIRPDYHDVLHRMGRNLLRFLGNHADSDLLGKRG